MSIPFIHITALYLLWSYLLLCLAVKLGWDFYKKHRREADRAAVSDFFRPGTGGVQSPEFQAVRRLCRQPECFVLACDAYVQQRSGLSAAEQARLYTCLIRLFHDQLDSDQKKYPLFRCMLLERAALCQLRSPRIAEFLDRCEHGSQLERLWCARSAPVVTGGMK